MMRSLFHAFWPALAVTFALSAPATAATPCRAVHPGAFPIPFAGAVGDLLIDSSCTYLFVTDRARKEVAVISTATGERRSPISVGPAPDSLAMSPDGSTLYVTNAGDMSLSVIDAERRVLIRTVTFEDYLSDGRDWSDVPSPVSVAPDGRVFYLRGPHLMIYDPSSATVTKRKDFLGPYRPTMSASSGGTALIFREGPLDPTTRYDVLADRFSELPTLRNRILAVDATGELILGGNTELFDRNLERIAILMPNVLSSYGAVIAPDNATAYHGAGDSLDVLDLKSFRKTGSIRLNTMWTEAAMDISDDGRLIAVRTTSSIILVTPDAPFSQPLQASVFSGADPERAHSILQFHNAGAGEGYARITLADSYGGGTLMTWDSLPIPGGASHDFDIRLIEAAMPPDMIKPPGYLLTVTANFPGTLTHVASDPSTGARTNLSTCSANVASQTRSVAGVFGGKSVEQQSQVTIVNTTDSAQPATLAFFDAQTGRRLGAFTESAVPGNGAIPYRSTDAERIIGLTPPAGQRYVVKIEGDFEGYLQHVLWNTRAAASSDMTRVCTLPGPAN